MKKYILLYIFLIFVSVSYAEVKQVGTPRVQNYPNTIYHAGTQSWGIDVGPNGMVYFANNECILEFDGVGWRQYPLPGLTVVRSVFAADDGRVYAGGFNEFGFFQVDSLGSFEFTSLQNLLPQNKRDFEDVWKIYPLGNAVVFQSYSQLMVYENDTCTVVPAPTTFHFSFLVNNRIYVNDTGLGLLYFDGKNLQQLKGTEALYGKLVWSVLPFYDNEILIATGSDGIFRYDGKSLYPWENAVSEMLMKNQVFCGLQISESEYAFGTILSGLIICNKSGELLQHLTIDKGLLNNTVLSLCLDQYDNLWLGLDNGIDYIGINSPLTYFSSYNNLSSGYATVIHDGYIYFGTNQGVFCSAWDELQNAKGDPGFEMVPGTQGQVWSLEVIDGKLFCGHNSGAYIIEGKKASQISDVQGGWTFSQPSDRDDIIIGGTYFGLVMYQKINEQWQFIGKIEGFEESSRYLFLDHPNSLWISHGYQGVYHISFTQEYDKVDKVDFYTVGRGFPDDEKLTLNNIDRKPVFTSGNHLYYFEADADTFLLDTALEEKLGFTEISTLKQDHENNIWYFTPRDMGVFRKKEDGSYTHVTIPFRELQDDYIKWFQSIYPYDDGNIFIGTQSGFVHYTASYDRDYQIDFNTYLRKVTILGGVDSVIFNGYKVLDDESVTLPYKYRNLQFDFSSNDFENQDKVTYFTMLDDFDDEWINNGNASSRQFTNLRQGDYTFFVKAVNAWGVESSTDTYTFHVNAPWYFSVIAYVTYFLILVFAAYLFVKRTLKTIRLSQQRYREQQDREFAERSRQLQIENLKAEKEVIRLRNEKLRSEKKAKDMELANTTMQIIQTSKALASLKTDLKMLSKELGDHSAAGRLNRILRKVDRNIDSDKQWEVFEKHFTSVHEEFLNRLKKDYPDLSPREMKLCAYLRLNISSKEIADLMNISVRGVEISRYRLRKKLQLDHDQNLTDFIVKY